MSELNIKQIGTQLFPSPCGKIKLYIENDTALGVFHDFLMWMKGEMVNRMIASQKQEEQVAAAQRAAQEEKPAEDSQPEVQA